MNQYKFSSQSFTIEFTAWSIYENFLALTFKIHNHSAITLDPTSIFLRYSNIDLMPTETPQFYEYVLFDNLIRSIPLNGYCHYSSSSTIAYNEVKRFGIVFKLNNSSLKNFDFVIKTEDNFNFYPLNNFLQDDSRNISKLFPHSVNRALNLMKVLGTL